MSGEVFTQPGRKSAHVIQEVPNLSRDNIVLSSGSFITGEVLGVSADGSKFVKLDLDDQAAAGAEAKAILFGDVDASKEDKPGIGHTRMTAVRADKLVWPDGITEQRKLEFIEQLLAEHIVPR